MRSVLSKFVSSMLIVLASLSPSATMAHGKVEVAPVKLAPAPDANAVQVSSVESALDRQPAARGALAGSSQDGADDSLLSHKKGTILAALVLMCAIAIRRHRSGQR
ncbi:MAG: hypothetical protein JWP47_1133 [Polaromonas sp.]|nr:hypothetical protein [Polaromonas sp.]